MKVNLTGHNVDITSGIKEHVEAKVSKIASHYPSLISVNVILSKERGEDQVEVVTNYEGSSISARANDKTLYPALAQTLKKLDSALSHRKGVLKAKLHEKPVSNSPEIAHEIIQDMKLV